MKKRLQVKRRHSNLHSFSFSRHCSCHLASSTWSYGIRLEPSVSAACNPPSPSQLTNLKRHPFLDSQCSVSGLRFTFEMPAALCPSPPSSSPFTLHQPLVSSSRHSHCGAGHCSRCAFSCIPAGDCNCCRLCHSATPFHQSLYIIIHNNTVAGRAGMGT